MKAAADKPGRLRVRMTDHEGLQEIRLILTYEAAMRGLTLGQACCDLVMEAVDQESYPPEVRERLDEIAKASDRRGVERSLLMSENC